MVYCFLFKHTAATSLKQKLKKEEEDLTDRKSEQGEFVSVSSPEGLLSQKLST